MEDQSFTTADLMAVADVPNSRVSEISRTLGIRGRPCRGGSAPSQYTVEQAVLIILVRQLQQLGMSVVDAAKAVRKVTHQDLKRIIITDAPEWLVVFQDGRAEVCDGEFMLDLAEGRGGTLTGLRIVNIHTALKDIFMARLERLNAMEQATESESIVAGCSASPGTTGIDRAAWRPSGFDLSPRQGIAGPIDARDGAEFRPTARGDSRRAARGQAGGFGD